MRTGVGEERRIWNTDRNMCVLGISQCWHYWYLGLDKSLCARVGKWGAGGGGASCAL